MSIKVKKDSAKAPSKKSNILLGILFLLIGAVVFVTVKNKKERPVSNKYIAGAKFDQLKFSSTKKFEPRSYGKIVLPSSASMKQFASQVGNQGQQGSCVGWAIAYAGQTMLYKSLGYPVEPFSPSYLYNQIDLGGCDGSYISDGVDSLYNNGGLPLSQFPYDDETCGLPPLGQELINGRSNKIEGYQRIGNWHSIDIQGMKEHLVSNHPIVVGMWVGWSFMDMMEGQKIWKPTIEDENDEELGGHAFTIIGYDDSKYGGAFEIQNSWGTEWGDEGFAWITYRDFKHYGTEAFALIGDGDSYVEVIEEEVIEIQSDVVLNAKIGLMPTATLTYDSIQQNVVGELMKIRYSVSGKALKNTTPFPIDTEFKLFLENTDGIYIYAFAEEINGNCSVLFPYTKQHSEYISTIGQRIFPASDYSYYFKDDGGNSEIVVLLSKTPFDIQALCSVIQSNGDTKGFVNKMQVSLGDYVIRPKLNVKNGLVTINQPLGNKEQCLMVVFDISKS